MAIFSRTQIPKYQNPIRITRPYIKPNYLADTITSAIQGYGSIQNMNLQQQLFNAKLKATADAKAKDDLDKAAYASMINAYQPGVPAGPATMNLQGGDPYGIAGIPAYSQGALNQTYQYDAPAVPSTSPMDSLKMAMQNNPNADPRRLVAMAAAIESLQPKPEKAPSWYQRYMMSRHQAKDKADVVKIQKAFETNVEKLVNESWGPLLEGKDEDIAIRFPLDTKPVIGERKWNQPHTWPTSIGPGQQPGFGDYEVGTVTNYDSGPVKFREFISGRGKQLATWMLQNDYSESEVRNLFARMQEAAFSGGTAFDYVKAWGVVPNEIAKNISSPGGRRGTTNQRAQSHQLRFPNR